ncbi:unnamed protein product [Musa acuminata subsp. burmannicoides]
MTGSIRALSLVSRTCVRPLPFRSIEDGLVESPNPRFPGDLFPAARYSQRRKPRCRRRLPVSRSSLAAFQFTQACRCGCHRRDPAFAAQLPPSGMGLWTLLEGLLLLANALAILNEDRFLAPKGWSFNEVSGGARAKSLKGQLIGLIYATQYLRVPLIILNAIIIVVKLVSG